MKTLRKNLISNSPDVHSAITNLRCRSCITYEPKTWCSIYNINSWTIETSQTYFRKNPKLKR